MGKSSFEDEIKQSIEDVIKEDKKRIQLAYENIKKRVRVEIGNVIQESMISNYYNGYSPLIYERTSQLSKSVAPLLLDESTDTDFQFSFGIKLTTPYGPKAMDHSTLTIVIHKKGKSYQYTYQVDADEGAIFNNFMKGIHPNANELGIMEPKTTPVFEEVNKAIDKLLTSGIIDKIIQDAFLK